MTKILVAMSGGVDSSTTAFRLLKEGYEVEGITLNMGRTCDKSVIEGAKIIAQKLDIKHHVLDVGNKFNKRIIDYFINSYKSGETPNPCAMCNRFIKFEEMINFLKEKDFDFLATGHYANIFFENGKYTLNKAKCHDRDQSYFLSTLKYDFLQYIKFPLGQEITKDNVREEAKNFDEEIAAKKDSQDICFIEKDYKDFLKNKISSKSGQIKHINGDVLGEHNGIINYTIGQRKGLGISYKKPIFVVRFDIENNTIYVSDNENDLYNDRLYINNVNVLADLRPEYLIKLRSTHKGEMGRVNLLENSRAEIILNNKTRAITKGQLACFYDGDKVVGSGWIE